MPRITGIVIAAILAGPAMAADLSVSPPPAPPAYNWTGLYFGINGGGAWGQQDPFNILTNRFDHVSINYSGGEVGGTAGVQLQIAHVVLGFELDLDWVGVSGSSVLTPTIFGTPVGFSVNATTSINWDLTARTRVGYAQDNWLFFATFGVAVLGAKTNLTTLSGLTCGTFGIIGSGPGEVKCQEATSGSARHLEPALNMGLRPIGALRSSIATPPRPRSNSRTSTRCWWA